MLDFFIMYYRFGSVLHLLTENQTKPVSFEEKEQKKTNLIDFFFSVFDFFSVDFLPFHWFSSILNTREDKEVD